MHTSHTEDFVRYLRTIRVAPNGHPHTTKRPFLDKGIQYILETCRTLFSYAMKRRHLSPYAENPFTALDLGRLPIEYVRRIVLPTTERQVAFLHSCDARRFPVFLTLMLTGLRPRELVHLLLSNDLDFEQRLLFVRNRPNLDRQVKTRNERKIPLLPCLSEVLRVLVGNGKTEPVVLRCRFRTERLPSWSYVSAAEAVTVSANPDVRVHECNGVFTRGTISTRTTAMDVRLGSSRPTRPRPPEVHASDQETRTAGSHGIDDSAASFRHHTSGCERDPLIWNELMGHSPASAIGGTSLGMTATYAHPIGYQAATVRTRPKTMSPFAPRKRALSRSERRQTAESFLDRFLEMAFEQNPISRIAMEWGISQSHRVFGSSGQRLSKSMNEGPHNG